MNHRIDELVLRRPEPRDVEPLYQQKNDPEVAGLLGGFTLGYSRQDISDWIERHRKLADEVIWVIAEAESDRCLGHVGLYQIDGRVRSAEFAIMVGDKASWGRGIGKRVTRFAIRYGFSWLNLNRLQLSYLGTNLRAAKLYEGLGFKREGVLREAQYKDGRFIDVVVMSMMRSEYDDASV